jgi:hypothetical protein
MLQSRFGGFAQFIQFNHGSVPRRVLRPVRNDE